MLNTIKLMTCAIATSIAATCWSGYYVRPYTTSGYGDGTGTKYSEAFNGFSNIDWTKVSGNKTLYVCGTHRDTLTVGASGESKNKRLIIRGDYPSDSGEIVGDDVLTGSWSTSSSSNIYKYNYGGTDEPKMLYLNGKVGQYDTTPGADGEWYYAAPYIYLYSKNGFPTSVYNEISVSSRSRGIYIKNRDNIQIYKLKLKRIAAPQAGVYHGYEGAIMVRGSQNCSIDYCTIESSAYAIRTNLDSDNTFIRHNTITGMVKRAEDYHDVPYAIITTGNSTRIYDNYINGKVNFYAGLRAVMNSFGIRCETYHADSSKLPTGTSRTYYSKNNRIYLNKIYNVGLTGIIIWNNSKDGNSYATAYPVNIWIYDNVLDQNQVNTQAEVSDTDGIALGAATGGNSPGYNTFFSGVYIFRNYVDEFANSGIHVANSWGKDVNIKFNVVRKCTLKRPSMGAIKIQHGAKIYNNIIYNTRYRHSIRVSAPDAYHSDAPPCEIWNNIIQTDLYNASDYLAYAIYVAQSGNAIGGNNCIYGLNGVLPANRLTHNFTNSNELTADPKIISPNGSKDWELHSDSPCLEPGAGHAIKSYETKDFYSKPIDPNDPPVGATGEKNNP
jgi:hypothetical protein